MEHKHTFYLIWDSENYSMNRINNHWRYIKSSCTTGNTTLNKKQSPNRPNFSIEKVTSYRKRENMRTNQQNTQKYGARETHGLQEVVAAPVTNVSQRCLVGPYGKMASLVQTKPIQA